MTAHAATSTFTHFKDVSQSWFELKKKKQTLRGTVYVPVSLNSIYAPEFLKTILGFLQWEHTPDNEGLGAGFQL